jgi:hypothetical protein
MIEAQAEKTLDLLRGRERTPLRMGKTGARMAEPRELDEFTGDRIGHTDFVRFVYRAPCHAASNTIWRPKCVRAVAMWLPRRDPARNRTLHPICDHDPEGARDTAARDDIDLGSETFKGEHRAELNSAESRFVKGRRRPTPI